MEKMSKTAKVLDVICKVLFWVHLAACVILCLAVIFGAVQMFMQITSGQADGVITVMSVQLDQVVFELAEEAWSLAKNGREVLWIFSLLIAAISVGASCYGLAVIRRILAPMKEQRPFAETVSRDLKKLGWFTILVGAVNSVMEVAMDTAVFRYYDFSTLFLSDKITGVSVETTIDLTFLIVAAVVFLLSYIFRYGASLQQLSDETL